VFATAPALQRTASQELRAALRPGHKPNKKAGVAGTEMTVVMGPRFREDDGGVWRDGGVYDAVTTTASPSGASTTFKPQACAKSRV
jgi:hypothetical protein